MLLPGEMEHIYTQKLSLLLSIQNVAYPIKEQ